MGPVEMVMVPSPDREPIDSQTSTLSTPVKRARKKELVPDEPAIVATPPVPSWLSVMVRLSAKLPPLRHGERDLLTRDVHRPLRDQPLPEPGADLVEDRGRHGVVGDPAVGGREARRERGELDPVRVG